MKKEGKVELIIKAKYFDTVKLRYYKDSIIRSLGKVGRRILISTTAKHFEPHPAILFDL